MKISFGKYKGKELADIPEDYLVWLAKGGGYTTGKHSTDMRFKIPVPIWCEARSILQGRGYRIIGERIEKDDE
jgi:hypothetical protein